MPKSKAEQAEAIRHVTASWEARGYRLEYLIAHQDVKNPDPTGEVAYQRAFAEAAKKHPPRLPNPAHYPNSPSAQNLIQRQNQEIFNARPTDAPNPRYEQPIADIYWRSKDGDHKYRSASSTPPMANGQPHHPSPLQMNGQVAQPNGQAYVSAPGPGSNPPLLMEPKLGAPMGPPSRFR